MSNREPRSLTQSLRLQQCLDWILFCFPAYLRNQSRQYRLASSFPSSDSWYQVDEEISSRLYLHQRFWWRNSGRVLATLLCKADYSLSAQHHHLKVFAEEIAPCLGVTHQYSGSNQAWKSYMTDDGTPIELSWDWGTTGDRPVIRYSIEPISLAAGTQFDPHNAIGSQYHQRLRKFLPNARLDWFEYFQRCFEVEDKLKLAPDRYTKSAPRVFFAFDLSDDGTTAKAYFFPQDSARARGISEVARISEVIAAAPLCDSKVKPLWLLREWAEASRAKPLEFPILAIDLVDPRESRLKIYVRNRETHFDSVVDVMSLGGLVQEKGLTKGLARLKVLWNALFDVGASPDQSLSANPHETAGILYNFEFRPGDRVPSCKIYIPVRHYSKSDAEILKRLGWYLEHEKRDRYLSTFVELMEAVFDTRSMRRDCGLQTYLGVSIRPDGSLRLVSYLNPQISKLSMTA